MKASSAEWKKNVYEDNRKFVYKTDITLADGTVLHVNNAQIMKNGVSFTGATSESGVFSIGSMVSSKVTVRLNNIYDDFSEYDFTDATAYVYVGMILSETTEWLKLGQFNVEQPTTRTSIISLEMLDNLSKTDKVYVPAVSFPCTRLQLAQDACNQSGIYLNTTNFYGWNQSVAAFDITSTMTCRQILSYIAQVGCLYGMCDENGYLNFKWYDTALIDRFRTNIDGGNFTDYTSGTTANGGNFTDYSSGDVFDGGSFTDVDNVAYVYSIKSQEINTDDVVITGVKITYQFSDDETKELKVGTDGYVIGISENPLINKGNVQAIANYIYSIIGGLIFRPLTVNALADPRVEPGDIGVVIDRKQNVYPCIFTTLSVTYGGYETYTCDAESAARNSAAMYSAATQAIVAARENTKKQISSYDQAVQRLTNLMTNCFGVFKTEEVQDDGSVIYYMHDKSTLADSMTIWKMTVDGFAVSTDGGTNYDAGFDAQGNAVFNVLNAIGINAEWINTGTLTVGGLDNKDGTIDVKNAAGQVVANIDKDGYITVDPNDKTVYTAMTSGGVVSVGKNADDNLELDISRGAAVLYDKTTGDYAQWYGSTFLLYDKSQKLRLLFDGSFCLDTPSTPLGDDGNIVLDVDKDSGYIDVPFTFYKKVSFGTSDAYYIGTNGSLYANNVVALGRNYYVRNAADNDNITILGLSASTNAAYVGNADANLVLRGTSVHLKTSSGETVTSDERLKNSFKNLDEFNDVYMSLNPFAYKYNNGTSGRYHFGFGARAVRDAFLEKGFTTQDFGGFVQMSDSEENDDYCGVDDPVGLIYTEFVSWNTHMIQKQKKRIDELESKVSKQEEKIKALCEKVGVEYGDN